MRLMRRTKKKMTCQHALDEAQQQSDTAQCKVQAHQEKLQHAREAYAQQQQQQQARIQAQLTTPPAARTTATTAASITRAREASTARHAAADHNLCS